MFFFINGTGVILAMKNFRLQTVKGTSVLKCKLVSVYIFYKGKKLI